jgi:uncharacterized cupin superfamily protein
MLRKSEEPGSDYRIDLDAMEGFYDEPGERGWTLEGEKHGFSNISVIITETAPFGGPPLHSHSSEEIHILPAAHLAYVMEDHFIEVEGPCAMNIPAGVAHTFLNIGTEAIRIVCFFPHNSFWSNYDELGPNPLLQRYGVVQPQG